MNFYRSDFKHKIYGLYTGKYGMMEWHNDLKTTHEALSILISRLTELSVIIAYTFTKPEMSRFTTPEMSRFTTPEMSRFTTPEMSRFTTPEMSRRPMSAPRSISNRTMLGSSMQSNSKVSSSVFCIFI